MKKIGIIGGMGPEATAAFYSGIFRIFQRKFGARYDEDYPEMIIISLPLPDVVECRGNEGAVISMLADAARRLESAGADFIAIPCNTASLYIGCVENAVSVPVLNIIDETAKSVSETPCRRVGLLATESTAKSRAYEKFLGRYGIGVVLPGRNMQKSLNDIIMRVLSGRKTDEDRNTVLGMIDYLAARGADAVILGCTDLPLLINEGDGKARLFNTLEILSESAVENATGRTYQR